MKACLSMLFFLVLSLGFAQEEEKDVKDFKQSSNKYYIGASVSPAVVSLLNGDNWEPEWKILYKQRLKANNHYLRASYSVLGPKRSYYNYWDQENGFDNRITYALNDSMDWTTGSFKKLSSTQIVKVGYEYQFKVGEKRRVSVNMGSDFLLGFNPGKIYNANDTLTYRNEIIDGFMYRNVVDFNSNSEVIARTQVFYGLSPFVSLGVPLKKRFDLTFEMAFDCSFVPATKQHNDVSNTNVDYRPSIMLSYRFDEAVVRNKTRSKGSGR